MIFMVNDKRIEIYIHEIGEKTKFPVFVTLPPSIIRKVTFLNNEECTTSESNLKTILIVAQKTLNLWNEKAEQESEYPIRQKAGQIPCFFILRFFKKILDNRTKGGYNIDKR